MRRVGRQNLEGNNAKGLAWWMSKDRVKRDWRKRRNLEEGSDKENKK